MRKLTICVLVTLSAFVTWAPGTLAQEGPYTRFGAEAGGNATGDIPAFEGAKGLTCPGNYQKGEYLPNPYAAEKPLFRIDHTNVDQYAQRLSPGQIERLRRHKNYYMNVFPSHRNFEHPEGYLAATDKNRQTCKLDEQHVLHGFNGGLPYPAPKDGYEAIWNVKKPWAGDDLITDDCRRVVDPSGQIRKSRWTTKIMAFDETRMTGQVPNPEGVTLKIVSFYSYPADREGEASLSFAYIDDNKETDVWSYLPTLRRVRRAPTLVGGTQLDGESTVDEIGFDFRDNINEWTWKLLGKKELYVAANNYEVWKLGAKDEEECHPQDLNPERIRYELHRVWVVEGTLAEGQSHPYSKRVSYYDEDFWQPVVAERYDKRNNLWRMAEYFQCYNYCTKQRYVIGYIYVNLESGRYEVFGGCRNENTRTNATDIGLKEEEFTVQALRKLGR
ncbi:MAG: DUF1329 domain-containing protein [bacterium]